MALMIDGAPRDLTPIATFRARFGLPDNWGVALLEGETNTQHAPLSPDELAALAAVEAAVLAGIPSAVPVDQVIHYTDALAALFRAELQRRDNVLALEAEKLDFAASGFRDIALQQAYALIQAWHRTGGEPSALRAAFDPEAAHLQWVNDNLRIVGTAHDVHHGERVWQVAVLHTPFGQSGLVVRDTASGETHYLADSALTCPAEAFMQRLGMAVGERLLAAVVAGRSAAA